jgi:hypothetical protein
VLVDIFRLVVVGGLAKANRLLDKLINIRTGALHGTNELGASMELV